MKRTIAAKPFLKWAGGKGQLLGEITNSSPAHFDTYIEPFVGSGAVLFDILSTRPSVQKAIINDINGDLINTYRTIRNNHLEMVKVLLELQTEYLSLDATGRQEMFYSVRDRYNGRMEDNIHQACFFIFLNRTCFNGLYRVNSKNLFNVPHGKYKTPKICDPDNLTAVAEALKKVDIRNADYEALKGEITKDCFIYLDPPYKPISETSTFNSYSADKFDDDEQVRLKNFCDYINEQGALFMLSNSDPTNTDENNRFFDELYKEYNIRRVRARRNINSNGSERGEINELLITNYPNGTLLFG